MLHHSLAILEGEHEFLDSPLSFSVGSSSLFFTSAMNMHVCLSEGLLKGMQWVHVLGEVKKSILISELYFTFELSVVL